MSSSGIKKLNIIIHYHSIAFEQNGSIWLQSSIGVWVEELSKLFGKVGLLLFISKEKLDNQDYCINSQNVILHPLGHTGQRNRLRRDLKAKSVCREASPQYNCLIIRGITPKQLLVNESCKLELKIFYFVGSVKDSTPEVSFSLFSIFLRFIHRLRLNQMKIILNNSSVFSNSPYVVKEIDYYFRKKAVFVPTNTLSEKFYIYRSSRASNYVLKLMFCGRVVKEKGIEDLLFAIKILRERQIACQLQVVGKGTPVYIQHLISIAEREGINDSLIFSGFIAFGERLMNIYRESDVFILPSWHEGFPRTIWEAAASCTPIIATNVGGIQGLISNKEAFLIAPKSPMDITEAIVGIIGNPDIVQQKVNSAYQLALNYTSERCATALANEITYKYNEKYNKTLD